MKMLLRILAFPLLLVLGILYIVFRFLYSLFSGVILPIFSIMIVLFAIIAFFTDTFHGVLIGYILFSVLIILFGVFGYSVLEVLTASLYRFVLAKPKKSQQAEQPVIHQHIYYIHNTDDISDIHQIQGDEL